MAVVIPISTRYDGKGFDQAERDAKRAEREAIAATRRQIAEHRKVAQLTAKLDRDIANERQKQIELTKNLGAAAVTAFAVLAKAGFDAVQAAKESAASDRELLGVLNSTGKATAGFKEQLSGLATELENNSNFTDEAIQHAEGLLLTFDKVGRDVMPRATQAAADLAELMDGDLQGAAIQVGKALDGQVSALKRSGVSFTEAQEEQIKALFESGKAAEAQTIILAQLEKQVAGQAKAAREAAGGWKDMEVSAGRLQEAIGGLLQEIGDAGVSGAVASFFDKLTAGATAWQGAIENASLLAEANARLAVETGEATVSQTVYNAAIEKAAANEEVYAGQLQSLIEWWYGASEASEDLAGKVQEVAKEQADAKSAQEATARAARDQAEAEAEAAAAMAKSADSAEDLAKKLEKANEARRNVARDLIDITEQAAEDTQQTWDDYFEAEADAWQEHSEAVEKINADSEEKRIQIQKELAKELLDIDKDLAKDLARVDKDLARDKAKLQRDTERQIARMQQDAARQEKRERRQRQIDARGDQRLFDFEMRQLAAEGEFNAILAAKERRAIEKQIEAEKQTEEQAAKDEERQIEIERTRQDARDRLAEMEAEAEERKQMLQEQAEEQRQAAIEQAAEEEARRQEELAQALADEEANYQERLQQLRENRDEKLAEIEKTKEESIAKLAEELTETKDLTREEMEALIPIAAELGADVGTAFAKGMSGGFAENQRINDMLNPSALGGDEPRINPAHPGSGSNIGGNAPASSPSSPSIYGFQHGGAFTVGGMGGPDSQLVSFLATPGERVTVQPPGGSTFNINVNGPGGRELAAIIQRKVQEGVDEYHNEVIVPWSNGV